MTREDRVFALLTDANPIPNVDEFDLHILRGGQYLETLEDQDSKPIELDKRPRYERNHQRRLASRLVAATLVIFAGTAAAILWSQSLQQDLAGPDPSELIGTWEYVLDPTTSQLVMQDFGGLVESSNQVVMRVGFEDRVYWQGFLFDGVMFPGDSGSLDVEGDLLILTGAQGTIRAKYGWSVDEGRVTLVWLDQCWISSEGDDCTEDRSRMDSEDPLTIPLWESTFIKVSDDTAFQLGSQTASSTP